MPKDPSAGDLWHLSGPVPRSRRWDYEQYLIKADAMITPGTLRRQAQRAWPSERLLCPVFVSPMSMHSGEAILSVPHSPESKAEAKASSPSYWPAPSRRGQVSAAAIFTACRSPGPLARARHRADR